MLLCLNVVYYCMAIGYKNSDLSLSNSNKNINNEVRKNLLPFWWKIFMFNEIFWFYFWIRRSSTLIYDVKEGLPINQFFWIFWKNCLVRRLKVTDFFKRNWSIKVHIFWEGHKILRNLPLTFDNIYCSQK